jgi:predicted RNA binding protein with dsRBD fold (UPF0201 family)
MAGRTGTFDADFLAGGKPRAKVKTRHAKKMERFGPAAGGERFERVPLRASVTVRARVFDTEEGTRVEAAVRALLPDVRFEVAPAGGGLVGHAEGLERMAQAIRSSRIRDTAREVLKGATGADGVIRVQLNKQAAAAGHVNFALAGRDPLGALQVEIRAPRPADLVEVLTWIDGESDERLLGTKVKAAAHGARQRAARRPPR